MHKLLSSRSRENRYGYLFILPALLYMILLIGYPLIYNFNLSFKNLDVMTFRGDSSIYVGFENYKTLLADEVFIQALRQTFVFTFWCLIFQFTFGFILALFFSRKFPLAGLIRGTILIGYMMPMSVTALVFKNMFATGTNEGVINYLLSVLGAVDPASPIGWLIGQQEALWAVIIANCWVGIPFNMLLLTGGLSGISEDIYEAATIDGANSFNRFIHITLPLLKPAILSVLMLGFIYTFKVFDLIFVMTKGGPLNATQVLSTYSYRLSFTEYKFSMGATGAVILFLCLMVVGLFYLWLVRNEESN
ncbi:MAG: multiple sugar transport system permease protein [Clostridiales bacterium]|jgi:multiple sugar transport system permease protein|nr:multiple sugar transport system permease protein [Clostridiales bacterium]